MRRCSRHTTRWVGIAVAALTAISATSCGTDVQGERSASISSRPACAECAIRMTPVATLGRRTDPVSPDSWAELARDSRGRYYVAPTVAKSEIAVYDSTGEFIRTIGRQGKGPGEFQLIFSITVGPRDTLFVLDFALRRLTVMSPDYEVVRTVAMAKVGQHLTVLPDGRMLVDYLSDFRGPSAGQPIHLLSASGELVRSFGVESPELTRDRFSANDRAFAPADNDEVWIAHHDRYEIERWSLTGETRRSLRRQAEWFPPWQDYRSHPVDVDRPRSTLNFLRQDANGLLWVFLTVADSNWQPSARAAAVRGRREVPVVPVGEESRYLDTVVEVIDPVRRRLVASTRFPTLLYGLLDDDLAYSWRSDAEGYLYIDVWRLELTGSV